MFNLVELERSMQRLHSMIDANNRDIASALVNGSLKGQDLRAAAYRCMGCGHTAACAFWLAGDRDTAAVAPPAFCPNHETIRALPRTSSPLNH